MRVEVYLLLASATVLLSVPLVSFAALTTGATRGGCGAAFNSSSECTAEAPCRSTDKTLTVYVPHNSPGCATSIEGCVATSKRSLSGDCTPMTVDCVRLGKCRYATCASDSSNYGKYFNLGTVTYRSALDMRTYSVPDVVCYVHDTGGAFKGRPDKLDLATTVCPTCTDAQAGRIAVNTAVALGEGAQDASRRYASLYNQATPSGLTAGQNCIVSTEPLIVVPCESIANRSAQPSGASASAPAQAANYPAQSAIPTSNVLSPAALPPAQAVEKPEQTKSSVAELLAALVAPTSSTGSLFTGLPLALTKSVGTEGAGLTPTGVSGIPPEATQPVPGAPQGTNTFVPTYRSQDLRWSVWNTAPFFKPFFLEIESMVRSILDLIRGL